MQTISYIPIGKLKNNDSNPRIIKDASFANLCKSIVDNPDYFETRPILANKDLVVFAGNMRLRAAKQAGLKEVPVAIMDIPEERQKELMMRDNIQDGIWDWDKLANEWDEKLLTEWGLQVPYSGAGTDAEVEWDGMPEYENDDLTPMRQIIVSFKTQDDINEFAMLVGQTITDKTKSLWFPKVEN